MVKIMPENEQKKLNIFPYTAFKIYTRQIYLIKQNHRFLDPQFFLENS